jgi:hypothetical protein
MLYFTRFQNSIDRVLGGGISGPLNWDKPKIIHDIFCSFGSVQQSIVLLKNELWVLLQILIERGKNMLVT